MLDFCFESCFFPCVTLESLLSQSLSDWLENDIFFRALILKVPLKLIYILINQQALTVSLLCCRVPATVLGPDYTRGMWKMLCPWGPLGPGAGMREPEIYHIHSFKNIYCTPT